MCGALLLSLGVLERQPELSWIDFGFATVALQASEFLPSLIGAALLVLAVALSQRVTLAWGATILLLVVAAVLAVAQHQPSWIPLVLVLAALLVLPYRSAFYRHARLISGTTLHASVAVPLFTLLTCVVALASFQRHVRWLGDSSFWKVILSPDVPNATRASVALAVGLGLVALWRLLRPVRVGWLTWGGEARRRYAELGDLPPAGADGVVWGEAERAGIAFRRIGRVMLALGDPVGAAGDRVSAVWRLRDLAHQEGLGPAVWGASSELLKVYADLGLAALPLGPDGLPGGRETAPPDRRRYLVCVAERDLPALLPLLPELARRRALPAPV